MKLGNLTRSYGRTREVIWAIKDAFAAAGFDEFVDVQFWTEAENGVRHEPVGDDEA